MHSEQSGRTESLRFRNCVILCEPKTLCIFSFEKKKTIREWFKNQIISCLVFHFKPKSQSLFTVKTWGPDNLNLDPIFIFRRRFDVSKSASLHSIVSTFTRWHGFSGFAATGTSSVCKPLMPSPLTQRNRKMQNAPRLLLVWIVTTIWGWR